MQTLRKKTSPLKYRNEPGRFFGDGVSFKAKLIGILEVGEARGDRMCQEALQDLKMAIRAAGEHKQRITIHVTIDGLRLRDEKTGDSLYHHPVHKISFIAQDMTDSRAFGYIFGSPDSGHRFFGIKTDKAASQVVLAMRDLFQVVFELKKKEIELARQHIQSKITAHEHQAVAMAVKTSNVDSYGKSSSGDGASCPLAGSGLAGASSLKSNVKCEKSPESVADLVDLEQELSSIQRGITQMERITPNEVPSKSVIDDDPFGDSFANIPPAYNLLPPPETSKRHLKQTHRSTENLPVAETSPAVVSSSPPIPSTPLAPSSQTAPPVCTTPGPAPATMSASNSNQNDDWLNSPPNTSRFDPEPAKYSDEPNLKELEEGCKFQFLQTHLSAPQPSSYTDVFTDLDPLGTGKIKPYIDKKFFFQELKNPPKKVLKDLSGRDSTFNANFSSDDHQRQSPRSIPSSTNITSSGGAESLKATFDEISARENEPSAADFLDPFASKAVDPFMEDEDFSKLHIDPFDVSFPRTATPKHNESKAQEDTATKLATISDEGKSDDSPVAYNGPLQVNLPPESWASYISQKRLERQNSDTTTSPGMGTTRNRPNVFKQNTVDVISSISSSSKKIKPNLFGQKFSKRDSNSINMRRLQESDSLSENETAPEPPPRPDSGSHIEPPPLPPKKQFADIVIRPSPRSGPSATPNSGGSTRERYDFIGSKLESKSQSTGDNAPPLPLPSRKVNRADSSSPGRPFKKLNEEDDYLQPITSKSEIPTLLPPPQRKDASKTRAARKSETDPRNLDEPTPPAHSKSPTSRDKESLIPDITLSQLLTLGIDELATKLNVPVSKLSTMTLVELTSYLSEFIENSKTSPSVASWNQEAENSDSPVFKVNFDDQNENTFVAKFDDNFGEENSFVANFDHLNQQQAHRTVAPPAPPPVDKYAVFREIIGQEIGSSPEPHKGDSRETGLNLTTLDFDREVASEMNRLSPNITADQFATSPSQSQSFTTASPVSVPMTKIDTKITEVISHAKDRYAALRDIILVEDLFEKSSPPAPPTSSAPIARMESSSFEDRDTEDEHKFETNFDDMIQEERQSPEINISDADINRDFPEQEEQQLQPSLQNLEIPESQNLSGFRSTPKEDLEIDAFMQKAVSNLSLHSTGQLSPAAQSGPGLTLKSPQLQSTSTSPSHPPQSRSPVAARDSSLLQDVSCDAAAKATLNDMSTSPIPIVKSPMAKSPTIMKASSSSLTKSPLQIAFAEGTTVLGGTKKSADPMQKRSSGSASDGGESSPEAERNRDIKPSKLTPTNNESWAVFDQPEPPPGQKKHDRGRSPKGRTDLLDKNGPDSPCSSDPKDEWKSDRDYGRRWPTKGHTSSSSRDVSPWDEDDPEYRKRPPSHHPPTSGERYHHPRMPPRRINSNDDDYEDELKERSERRRRMKGQISARSRDNFDDEHWYHEHQSWSPTDEDERPDRSRSFDRNAYERSTYGPPYEKREPKSMPAYDRRDYKNYDKRKYYRERSRPNYEYDPYSEGYDQRMMKGRVDYEDVYERAPRDSRAPREYFYERERKSFDRDSNESYDRRSLGSGDLYGSLDSRGDYRERDRYLSLDKSRSLRRGVRNSGSARLDDPDHDSEGDLIGGRRGDTNSLHRSSQNIRGKQQQVVDDEVWGMAMAGKSGWKRPSSATDQERRYNEGRRMLTSMTLAGSDGEKDRRFRKKSRNRSKESDIRPGYATMRYPPRSKEDYFDFDADTRGSGNGGSMYDNDEEDDVGSGKIINESIGESPSYYGRRQPSSYYKPPTPRSEGRTLNDSLIAQEAKKMSRYAYEEETMRRMKKSNSRDLYFEDEDKGRFSGKFGSGNFEAATPPKSAKNVRMEFEFEDFGDTPQSNTSSKFNFEGGDGFESDFNSPPVPPSGEIQTTHHSAKSFRFSNDFSEKESGRHHQSYHQKNQPPGFGGGFEADFTSTPRSAPGIQQTASKLRFNENVTISKFNAEANTAGTHMFEDDFTGRLDPELEDQWATDRQPSSAASNGSKKILKISSQHHSQSQDNIHKSDSVNIFAKKVEDPFEDDDFFSTGGTAAGEKDPFGSEANSGPGNDSTNAPGPGGQSGWDKNFANFDDNI
ncbi:protein disabled isoform X2 [Toxorhynchites rutilus septentrionalis]|uniref:protein disabled isoform X2 n=1 Tax=Toxorhynchites rutilus septentrionalis TaxID=329112 RepID=UPI002478A055|nr:protein disabled isoform X2 [Toxorhynchites rutilus septentrionalis]XP_055620362.1 protein disabled isoform X2 [Toxorhynchites rutilus septentrionalis]XP_055620363.1 protein disabled isoform X2 [Toxorhynchites rutilus septentrionalis]